jgi:hypothetical protein
MNKHRNETRFIGWGFDSLRNELALVEDGSNNAGGLSVARQIIPTLKDDDFTYSASIKQREMLQAYSSFFPISNFVGWGFGLL